MADGDVALQAVDDALGVEVVADQAHAAFGMKLLAVEGDDAAGFLAAMLERMQAERGQGRRVGVAQDAEDTAFLVEAVVVDIEVVRSWGIVRWCSSRWLVRHNHGSLLHRVFTV